MEISEKCQKNRLGFTLRRGSTHSSMTKPTRSPLPPPIRSVRVFLSSTFQDMQEEREELIRRVFPGLRERCEAQGVNWEKSTFDGASRSRRRGRAESCPSARPRSTNARPFFLAILGERYGWMPDAIDPAVECGTPG